MEDGSQAPVEVASASVVVAPDSAQAASIPPGMERTPSGILVPKSPARRIVERAAEVPEDVVDTLAEVRQEGIDGAASTPIAPPSGPGDEAEVVTPIDPGPVEAAPAEAGDGLELSENERTIYAVLAQGVRTVQAIAGSDDFTNPDLKIVAESAVSTNGTDVRSLFQVLNETAQMDGLDPDVRDQILKDHDQIAPSVVINFDGKTYGYSELMEERQSADEPRRKQIDAILAEGKYEHTVDADARLVDQAVSDQIEIIEEQVLEARRIGKPDGAKEQLLEHLKFSKAVTGEVGPALRARVLRELQANGVLGLDAPIARGKSIESNGLAELGMAIKRAGYSDNDVATITRQVVAGDVDSLFRSGALQKARLDTLLFGKNLDQKGVNQISEMMLTKEEASVLLTRYGKEAGGIILALILAGLFDKFRETLHA